MKELSRVVKRSDSKEPELSLLSELAKRPTLSMGVKSKIEQEMRNIRAGMAAEQRAEYLLSQLISAGDTAFIINDLRLEVGESVCQIDHLTINRYGVVRLFETKSFSTGVKVDEKGNFHRWDEYNRRYVEIPSPLRQSKRHEVVLKKILSKVGYSVSAIEHYVLVDYKARLIKPKQGFDNVCRPDAVEDAISSIVDKMSIATLLKRFFSMLKGKLSNERCRKVATALASLHRPIVFDYEKRFCTEGHQVNKDYDRLTTSKTAQRLGMRTKEFNVILEHEGYMKRVGGNLYLTEKGKSAGISFRRGRHAYYFLFPLDFSL